MIKITEQITEDNYHMLFSIADARRSDPNEIILVEGAIDLEDCESLISLPNNLTVTEFAYLDGCISLIELPKNLTVGQYLSIERCNISRVLPSCLIVPADRGDIFVDAIDEEEYKYKNPKFANQIIGN